MNPKDLISALAEKELNKRSVWIDKQCKKILGEFFWEKAKTRNPLWVHIIKKLFSIEIKHFLTDPERYEIWYKGKKYASKNFTNYLIPKNLRRK